VVVVWMITTGAIMFCAYGSLHRWFR